MTVPAQYATDFLTASLTGVTDVQSFIDEFVDNITLDLPVASRWTSLGGGQYKSPIQDDGGATRFLTITITRTSATRIAWVVRDQNGNVVMDGTFDIVGTASGRTYVGPFHAVLEVLYGGTTFEQGLGFMCDPSPYALNTSPNYVVGRTRRNSAGAAFGSQDNDQWAMNDNAGASTMNARIGGFTVSSSSNVTNGVTTGGSVITLSMDVSTRFSASNRKWVGRAYQLALVPLSVAAGTEIDVPLDDTTTGTFRVLGLASAGAATINANVAVRVA